MSDRYGLCAIWSVALTSTQGAFLFLLIAV